ncbi:alpha/beta hydrolase fold domain-containing protein [Actinomadura barringtoniae]|uniref:Alpha/beta hydrolase fold domain-containing protein n=1 Tax=Actinomadura barringtoniae TaxID=1427535 RepID=A0A939PAH4_9ACTN|nr:alpha/beta hydrolase fold domain-containing protein [Actinomadura barringtoniae]MBO2448980.1 alpha/beta hydrolase fold domain-containing protein [Actinomadura barringtoniae]
MTTSAVVHLRGFAGPVRGRVQWPEVRNPALLVYFHLGPSNRDTARPDAVVLDVCLDPPYETALRDAAAVLGWAADHGSELGADPARLLVAGAGEGAVIAVAVALQARDEGWPEVELVTGETPCMTDERTST